MNLTVPVRIPVWGAHVYPEFGNRQINTITSAELDAFHAAMRAKPKANGQPRSETSVLGAYKAAARTLTYAYKHRLIGFTPCVAVARTKADTLEARFLSVEEVMRISDELAAQPPYDLLVRLAAFTGLRTGEVAALHIRDIDLRADEVQVRLNKTHTGQGYQIGSPKSRAGRRDAPILDDSLLRDLGTLVRSHPHRVDLEASPWPGKVPGHNVLSYDRDFAPKGFYRYTFKPAWDRAGLSGLRFHELRHTFASSRWGPARSRCTSSPWRWVMSPRPSPTRSTPTNASATTALTARRSRLTLLRRR